MPQAAEPLKALGPDAIPLLDAWLDLPNSKLRDRVATFAIRRGLRWERFYMDRQQLAFFALYMTPSNAAPAAPKLLRLIEHGTPQQRLSATRVLSAILETAAETNRISIAQQSRVLFDSVLKDERLTYGSETYWLMGRLTRFYGEAERERLLRRGMDLREAGHRFGVEEFLDPDGTIRNLLHLESTNDAPKVGAAMKFRDSPIKPERVIPLLIDTLSSSNRSLLERSSQALSAYGAYAKPALPLLSNLLSHPKPAVARAAREAIAAISAAE